MTDEILLKYARERYEMEFAQRSHLMGYAGLYLTGLGIVVFIMWDMFKGFPLGSGFIHISLYVLSCALAIFTVLAFVNLFGFFQAKVVYAHLPLPDEVQTYMQELDAYFDQNYDQLYREKGSKTSLKRQRLDKNLLAAYISGAKHNNRANFFRSRKIHNGGLYLLLAFIVLVLSLIPYSILARSQEAQVGSRTLLIEGARTMSENNERTDAPDEKSEQKPQEKKPGPAPPEPKFPESKLFKEGKKKPEQQNDEQE